MISQKFNYVVHLKLVSGLKPLADRIIKEYKKLLIYNFPPHPSLLALLPPITLNPFVDGLHFLISLPLLMCIGQILLITAILPGKPIHGFVQHSSTLHSNKPCIRRKNYNGTGIQSHRGDLSTKFWHSMVYSRSWRFLYLYPSRFCLYPYASSTNIYRKPT